MRRTEVPPQTGETTKHEEYAGRLRPLISWLIKPIPAGAGRCPNLFNVDDEPGYSKGQLYEKGRCSRRVSHWHHVWIRCFRVCLGGADLVYVGQGLQPYRNGALAAGCCLYACNNRRSGNNLSKRISMAGMGSGTSRGWWFDFPLLHRSLQYARGVRALVSAGDAGLEDFVRSTGGLSLRREA